MLVLSRKLGESIVVHTSQGEVWIRVVKVSQEKVRLGITAPSEIQVMRKELIRAYELGGRN